MAYRCLGSDIYWQLGNFSCLDYHAADIMQPWTQGQVHKWYYQLRDTVSLVAMTYRITRYYTQRANITSRDNSSYLTFSCMLCGVYPCCITKSGRPSCPKMDCRRHIGEAINIQHVIRISETLTSVNLQYIILILGMFGVLKCYTYISIIDQIMSKFARVAFTNIVYL